MKKILITGSSGYIGQHLVKVLKNIYNLEGIDKIYNTNLKLNVIDINDLNYQIEDNYDTVIHLAALVNVGESVNNPTAYYQTNVFGTINILKNVKFNNFIFASTGAAEQLYSPYGISKKAAEEIVTEYCTTNNKPFTIFRFYNVIGQDGFDPSNPDGLFFNLIKAVKTKEFSLYGNTYNTLDGTCIRDYVHVNEVCHAIKLAIETPSLTVENLGHGKGYSVLEIVEKFKKANNVDFKIIIKDKRNGDLERSVLSTVSTYMKSLYSIEDLLKI